MRVRWTRRPALLLLCSENAELCAVWPVAGSGNGRGGSAWSGASLPSPLPCRLQAGRTPGHSPSPELAQSWWSTGAAQGWGSLLGDTWGCTPVAKDLASRDVVSRSMTLEIREGRSVWSCPPRPLVAGVRVCISARAGGLLCVSACHPPRRPRAVASVDCLPVYGL